MQTLFSHFHLHYVQFIVAEVNGTHFVYPPTSHLDKHNRLTGLNIEKDRIELWEESKDGSGKLCD